MKNVLIGGIGNILLGDDGIGPYVLQHLASRYEFGQGVEITDLGTPALDLLHRISDKHAAIFIDSVANDAPPGTVTLYRKADILRLRPEVRMDPHSPALVDTLLSADFFGVVPADILLVGITVETYEVGCRLSGPVQDSINSAVAAVLRELDRLGVEYRYRQHPLELGTWWDDRVENSVAAD